MHMKLMRFLNKAMRLLLSCLMNEMGVSLKQVHLSVISFLCILRVNINN